MPGRSYVGEEIPDPTVLQWPEFQAMFLQSHRLGEHVAIVGMNGRGKTVLGLELCKIVGSRMGKDRRPARVTVLAYKPRDDTMRMILPEKEWPNIKRWPPSYGQEHCIVWVRGGPPSQAAQKQKAVFAPLLDMVYQEGGQTIYIPEAAHFERKPPDGLGLTSLMTEFWTTARSNKLTVISDTQRPRWVTVSMWTEPNWLFVFQLTDRMDVKRVAELSGQERSVWAIMPQLGQFEFMCIRRQTGHDEVYISKVQQITRNKGDNSDK
jgi:hypothetical protein